MDWENGECFHHLIIAENDEGRKLLWSDISISLVPQVPTKVQDAIRYAKLHEEGKCGSGVFFAIYTIPPYFRQVFLRNDLIIVEKQKNRHGMIGTLSTLVNVI